MSNLSDQYLKGDITIEEYTYQVQEIYRKRRQRKNMKKTINKLFQIGLVALVTILAVTIVIGFVIVSFNTLTEFINKGEYVNAGGYGILILGLIFMFGYIGTAE